jgi:hypothetical protein
VSPTVSCSHLENRDGLPHGAAASARTPHCRSGRAPQRHQPGGHWEERPPGAHPRPLVSSGGASPAPAAHRRDWCATLDLVIDDTLERRWGSTIRTRGHDRERALSSRERSVSSPGVRWIVLAVVVTLPWTTHTGALPCVCVLAPPPEVRERLGTRHTTVAMWAQQMVSLVRRWLPDREITRMGETASTVLDVGLHAQALQVTLIPTGRLDAVLHEPPPEHTAHTSGRPRVGGQRVPALEQVWQDPNTVW